MLDAAAVAAVLDAANAAQWAERKAPGVQEFSFDSYVTLSSPVGGGTLLTLWKGVSALCMDAPGGRVWLDQPEGADLAAALQGLEQQDAYPRSLYAVGVTGSAEDETIAQSAAGAMVQSLSAHEARDGASSGVESLCGQPDALHVPLQAPCPGGQRCSMGRDARCRRRGGADAQLRPGPRCRRLLAPGCGGKCIRKVPRSHGIPWDRGISLPFCCCQSVNPR